MKKTNQKNNKKGFKMYSQWQTILEFIAIAIIIFIVSSIESIFNVEYLKLVGILVVIFIVDCELIHKFGK